MVCGRWRNLLKVNKRRRGPVFTDQVLHPPAPSTYLRHRHSQHRLPLHHLSPPLPTTVDYLSTSTTSTTLATSTIDEYLSPLSPSHLPVQPSTTYATSYHLLPPPTTFYHLLPPPTTDHLHLLPPPTTSYHLHLRPPPTTSITLTTYNHRRAPITTSWREW